MLAVIHLEPRVGPPHLDKVVHLCEYLVLSWLLMRTVRAHRALGSRDRLWVWLAASGYGAALELIQFSIPWRSGSGIDAIMNTVGAALGVWLADVWGQTPKTEKDT